MELASPLHYADSLGYGSSLESTPQCTENLKHNNVKLYFKAFMHACSKMVIFSQSFIFEASYLIKRPSLIRRTSCESDNAEITKIIHWNKLRFYSNISMDSATSSLLTD